MENTEIQNSQTDLFAETEEEFNYKKFLMIRPGGNFPVTSTEISCPKANSTVSDESPPGCSTLHTLLPLGNEIEAPKSSCNCKDVLQTMKTNQEAIEKMFQRLTQEVYNLRRELREEKALRNSTTISSIIPQKPFETVEELLEFEKTLQESSEKFNDLKTIFIQYGRNIDPRKFIKNNLRKMFDDMVAKEFSWRGTQLKKCAKTLLTVAALRNAFHATHAQAEDYFDQVAMRFFQYANERIKSKN